MKYFNRLAAVIGVNITFLLFASFFCFFSFAEGSSDGYYIAVSGALFIDGFIDIANYITSRKAAILFDHSSLLTGFIKCILGLMILMQVSPVDQVFFTTFAFFMFTSGFSHLEDVMFVKKVKDVLWQMLLIVAVLIMGTGALMFIMRPVNEPEAWLICGIGLFLEAGTSLYMILILRKHKTEFHEAALKIVDDVKEAIKKEEKEKKEEKKEAQTIINLVPLQGVSMLSPEEMKKLQEEGKLPTGNVSAIGYSANPSENVAVNKPEPADKKDENKKKESKPEEKIISFPDDLI